MVKLITIYVEGGGDNNKDLKAECRAGFRTFLKKLNITQRFKIVACGSRSSAFKDFRNKMKTIKPDEFCILLVDSEAPVNNASVWEHVSLREGDTHWKKPDNATEKNLHFMVECMENWFMADVKTLADYYGKDFNQNALPKNSNIENTAKTALLDSLKEATKNTTKGKYSKGNHSFEILSRIDANQVIAKSNYANRLYETLKELKTPSNS